MQPSQRPGRTTEVGHRGRLVRLVRLVSHRGSDSARGTHRGTQGNVPGAGASLTDRIRST